MSDLKPCPFCESDELELNETGAYFVAVNCDHCECSGPAVYKDQDEAIRLWNTRPIEDTLNARIKELESALIKQLESGLKETRRLLLLADSEGMCSHEGKDS